VGILNELNAASQKVLELTRKLDRDFVVKLDRAEYEKMDRARKNLLKAQMTLDLAVWVWHTKEVSDDKNRSRD